MNKLVRVFASAALLVSVVTLLTRLIGFLRWLVFSPTVGATSVGNAYQTANQVPNILFEVVAGGALAGAVIPLLAVPLARADKDTASRIASALLTWAITLTLPLSIILAVFARPIAGVLVGPAAKELEPTVVFLLMFAPQLVLYGIGAVLTGILQAHRKFLWPAFAPLLSSFVVIGCYIAYSAVGGNDFTWQTHIGWLGWGTTAGVAALALPLALPMRSTGIRIRPTWSFPPGVAHRALRLASAGMAALLAQQAAVLVTMMMSNRSGGTGTFVLFSYINAVYLLPYAVLAVPVATIMFPALSGWVARSTDPVTGEDERAEAGAELSRMTATTSALIVTVGLLGTAILMSAAAPLQTFFTGIDVAGGRSDAPFSAMSQAIMVMALAVPGWSFVAWGTRVFYALERSRYSAVSTSLGWVLVILGMLLAVVLTNANGDPGKTLVAICAGYVLGMSAAAASLLVAIVKALGRGSLHLLFKRAMLSLLAAVLASLVGVLLSLWLGSVLGIAPVSAVVNGVASALTATVVFFAVLLLDRSYLAEVRRLLAGRRGGPAVESAPQGTTAMSQTGPVVGTGSTDTSETGAGTGSTETTESGATSEPRRTTEKEDEQ